MGEQNLRKRHETEVAGALRAAHIPKRISSRFQPETKPGTLTSVVVQTVGLGRK